MTHCGVCYITKYCTLGEVYADSTVCPICSVSGYRTFATGMRCDSIYLSRHAATHFMHIKRLFRLLNDLGFNESLKAASATVVEKSYHGRRCTYIQLVDYLRVTYCLGPVPFLLDVQTAERLAFIIGHSKIESAPVLLNLRKIVTALCIMPWKINACSVSACYHGNFGEPLTCPEIHDDPYDPRNRGYLPYLIKNRNFVSKLMRDPDFWTTVARHTSPC